MVAIKHDLRHAQATTGRFHRLKSVCERVHQISNSRIIGKHGSYEYSSRETHKKVTASVLAHDQEVELVVYSEVLFLAEVNFDFYLSVPDPPLHCC